MASLPRAVTVVVAAGVLLSACTASPGGDGGDAGGSPTPSASTGPGEAQLDLSGRTVPRADVCDLIGAHAVEQALAGPVAETAHYGNGEEVEVTPGRVDVAHEYGCAYAAADGTVARTWVFARPVPPQEARTLVRRARRGRDCAFPESVRFGAPSVTSVCEVAGIPAGSDGDGPDAEGDAGSDADGTGPGAAGGSTPEEEPAVRARLEGLFQDTWVGCEVAEPVAVLETHDGRADVVQRAEQWCTDVVTAVSAATD